MAKIGTEYYAATLETTSVEANTNTVIIKKSGIPKGKYMISAQINGTTIPTGGCIGLSISNGAIKGSSALTIYNSGFVLNAGISSIVDVTADNSSINVSLYPKEAQTLTQGRLSIVRIA